MLKPIDLPIILSNEDYIELMGAPNKDFKEEDYLILNKWIVQATNQIDSMISAYNESGYLYRFWKSLKDNDEDNAKGYKLQLAIAKWVECMIISGKFWVDNLPTMSSNIQYDINSSSNDSNIEAKRKDIIKDLSSIGLLQTSNILDTNNNQINNQEVEELIVLSKEYLNNNFLALDSASRGQVIKSPINLANNSLNLAGDIQGVTVNGAKHVISNYRLKSCDFENLNAESANKILDNKDGLYKFIEEFPISTWKGLTAQEIFNLIQGYSGMWKAKFPYQVGSMTWANVDATGNTIAIYVSLVENNVGNEPLSNPTMWEVKNYTIDVEDIVKEVIKQSQPLNAIEIKKQIDALPTIEYKTEFREEIIPFSSERDFQSYLKQANIDEGYFEDVVDSNMKEYSIVEKEVFTGKYLFGKKIYAKSGVVNATRRIKLYELTLNVESIVSTFGFLYYSSDYNFAGHVLPITYGSNYLDTITFKIHGNGIYIDYFWNSDAIIHYIIEFTKERD